MAERTARRASPGGRAVADPNRADETAEAGVRKGPRFDASRHCGAHAKDDPNRFCRNRKGFKTDHVGAGHCFLHGGRTPNGRKFAVHEVAVAEALASFAGVPLKKLGEALAREAAARAIVTDPDDVERFTGNVRAFAQASERAEGSEVTIESRLTFLAELPDDELEAAIAEAQRLIAMARGGVG